MSQKVVVDSDGTLLSVRPQLSDQDIRELALSCYGLEVDPTLKPNQLNSYEDRNYMVQGRLKPRHNSSDDSYKNYQTFTLKIYNACFST